MLFRDPAFLFVFLPLTILIYYLSPNKVKNLILLFASILFYAWGEPLYVMIMILSIIVNYICGIMLSQYELYKRYIIIAGVGINLILLSTFKYTQFLIENYNVILSYLGFHPVASVSLPLPIGISFFTFQSISYIVDVYRKTVKSENNLINVALYISLFPQLIAGPIVRYHDISYQIRSRTVTLYDFSYGCKRFIFGLFKKVVIADTLAVAVDFIYKMPQEQLTTGVAWWGAACFMLQVYFDFSAYSDMAIGMGRMFGFHFLENFRYPYISTSVTELWTRWHISFSNWIRDYLFKPLGGFRGSKLKVASTLFIVFFLSGLWHGASWNYVIWGMIHGIFLVAEALGLKKILKRVPKIFGWFYVSLMFIVAAVIFRSSSMVRAVEHIKIMFSPVTSDHAVDSTIYMNNEIYLVFIIAIVISAPVYPFIQKKYREVIEKHDNISGKEYIQATSTSMIGIKIIDILLLAIILFVSGIYVAASTYQAFIYFQF